MVMGDVVPVSGKILTLGYESDGNEIQVRNQAKGLKIDKHSFQLVGHFKLSAWIRFCF